MAEETITILKVGTNEAVASVNDLKTNINELKKALGDLEIGSEEYQSTLKDLNINQAALKDALYATSASMEDVSAAAKGTSESYNSLVRQMAALKQEARAVDVSTEEGKARFRQLATEINGVNDKLKEMDALQGNYQRNVGNYKSALEGLHGIFPNIPPSMGKVKGALDGVDKSMRLMSTNPVFGIVALLSPLLIKITGELKENETAVGAIEKAMKALQPVFDLVKKAVEVMAGWISRAVDYFVELTAGSGETFKNIVAGAVGVGNAVLQFILTPIRTTIDAFKGLGNVVRDLFRGDFKAMKEDAAAAASGIKDAFVKGFSFGENFRVGKEVGEQFAAGLGSTKRTVRTAAAEVAQTATEELAKVTDAMINQMDRALAKQLEERKRIQAELKDIDAWIVDETAATTAEIDAIFEDLAEQDRRRAEEQAAMAKARVDMWNAVASTTSTLLGNIADAYEAASGDEEKAANRTKGLRIAAATIDTIAGAIGAFMNAQKTLPVGVAQAVGAAQAAAVTAAGVAQIAKIKAVKIGGSSAGSASSASVPAFVAAPSVQPVIQEVRNITGASEDDRLDRMAADQRVYLVTTELEAKMHDRRVQLSEASF